MQNIHNANLPSYTTTVLPTGQVVHGGPFLVQGAPVVYTQPQAVAVTPIVHQVPVAPIPHSVTPEAAQAIVGNDMLTNVAARGEVFSINAPKSLSSVTMVYVNVTSYNRWSDQRTTESQFSHR